MSRLETLLPTNFPDPLSGFQPTPGPFPELTPGAVPFESFFPPNVNEDLIQRIIQESLIPSEIRPAPELGTFQLLNAEFDRRFPREPARSDVEIRRRQLGEPIPGPQSTPEELAEFEREIELRRRHLAERTARDPLVETIIRGRIKEKRLLDPVKARLHFPALSTSEIAQLERFLDKATDQQLAEFAGIGQQRRQAQAVVAADEAVPLPVAGAARIARRAAQGATFGASEALITAGPTGARPLPGLIESGRTTGIPGAVAEGVAEVGGLVVGAAATGVNALATAVGQRLGVRNLIAQRAIEGAVALGALEAGSQTVKAPVSVAMGQDVQQAALQALEEIGISTAGGAAIGGAVGAVESGVRAVVGAVRAARQQKGVLGQLPAPEPVTPPQTPLAARPEPLPTELPTSLGVQATRARQPGPRAKAASAEPAVVTRQQEIAARQQVLRQEFAAGQPPVPRETPTVQPIPQGELPRAQPHPSRTAQARVQAEEIPLRPQAQVQPPTRRAEVQPPAAVEVTRPPAIEPIPGIVRPRAPETGAGITQERPVIVPAQPARKPPSEPAGVEKALEKPPGIIPQPSPRQLSFASFLDETGLGGASKTAMERTRRQFQRAINQGKIVDPTGEFTPRGGKVKPLRAKPPELPPPAAKARAAEPKPTTEAAKDLSDRQAQDLMEQFLGDITTGGFTPARVKAAASATIRFTQKLVEKIPQVVPEKGGQVVARRAGRAIADTPPLRFAAEAKDSLVGSVTARLRKIGPEGQEVERRLFEATDRAEDTAGRIAERLRSARQTAIEQEAKKTLRPPKRGTGAQAVEAAEAAEAKAAEAFENRLALERARVKIDAEYVALQKWKVYGGKKPAISEGAALLETEFGAVYEATGKVFDDLGGQVWEPTTGAYRQMRRIGKKGFPRWLKDDVAEALHKQSGKTYDALKATAQKSGIDLRALREAPNGFSPTLEKARGPALPAWAYDWEPEIVWPKWTRSTSKRLADIEWLGQKRFDVDAAIKSVPREDQAFVRQAFQRHFPERDTLLQRGLQQVVSFTVLEKLGLNYFVAIKNIAGGQANVIATVGWKRWVTSLNAAIRDPALRREIRASGALRQARVDIFNRAAADESFLAKGARKGLTVSGFLPGEVGNRISAAANFVRWAEWAASELKTSSGRELANLERGLRRLRLDPNKIRKQGGKLTQLERRRAMRVGANNTQFTSEFLFLPMWASSPIMRPATLFKKFAFGQARFWNQLVLPELTRGNLVPVLSILGIGTAVGELVNNTKAILSGSTREGKSFTEALEDRDFAAMWKRFANDLLTTGTFGLYGDVIEQVQATAQGRQRRSLVTPAILATPTNLGELLLRKVQQGELRGRDYWRALTREIPAIRTGYDAWNELTGLNDTQREYNNVRRQVFFYEKEKGIRSPRGTPSPATPYYADVREAMVDQSAELATALDEYATFARGRGDAFADARRRLGGHLRALRPLDLNATRKREFLAGVTSEERKQFTDLSRQYDKQMRRVLNELIREAWLRTAPAGLKKAG